jgi:hypothetical protein
VTGGWGKVHSEELHNLHSSPHIIRMIKLKKTRWVKHGQIRNTYKILVEKPEDLEKEARRRWEDNIKMDFREIRLEDVDWIHLVQVGTGGGLFRTR